MKTKLPGFLSEHKLEILLFLNVGVIALFIIGLLQMEEELTRERQAIIGQLYTLDNNVTKEVVDSMFLVKVTAENVDQGIAAMKELGYTDKGYDFLLRLLPADVNIIITGVLLLFILVIIIRLFRKTFQDHNSYLLGLNSRIIMSMKTREEFQSKYELSQEKNLLENSIKNLINQWLREALYAEKRNKQMQDFIENTAHQIKSPISSISLALDMMKEDLGTDNRRLEDCFLQICEIKSMIKRLLQIGSLEAGKIAFQRDKFNVYEMVESLVNKVSAGFPFTAVSMQKSDAEASDSMNYELDYEMFGDYEWLSEAIFNVISNCAEHAEGIGPVHVFIDSYKEFIRISVQDDGEGIAEEDIPFIFDRFYTRVKSSNIRGEFHAGIGLNLAKLIVEGHFGTITVHNRESGGTEFHLILPKYMLKEKVFQM